MLVLSRKCGEKIVLPEQGVELTILEIRGGKVRVGVSAPREVPVFRSEVWDRLATGETPSPAIGPCEAISAG